MTDTYVLTIWASQTLLDEATYHVTANSKKEAAALLMQLHNQASERGIAIECPEVTCAWRVPEQQHQVWRLDPNEIVRASEGVKDEDENPVEYDDDDGDDGEATGPVTFTR